MPRTSLAWRLFAGWCVLVALVLIACLWLANVQLAALATEGQRRRLLDAATALAAVVDPARPDARDALPARAAEIHAATGVDLEVFAGDGTPLAAAGPPGRDALLVEQARGGRLATGSRYDLASGRRFLALAVPFGPAGAPRVIVRASADTAAADRELARSQAGLWAGCLAIAAAAVATGYALARRCARPVADLCAAAARLAAGDVGTPIPVAEPVELGGLSAALERLRDQLVERGLTIGRQGTQQEAVLGSMIEGVLAIDARQRVVAINREAADLLGIDPARTAGRTLQEVVRNPDLRRFALTAIDCLEPVEDELVLHGPGGRDLTIELRGTALRDPSGEGGAVIVLNDVTDRQRLERVRRDFVANVSHELKTPVASIKGFVETLLDGAIDEPADARRFLEIVGRQADRLAAIIEDLLALSRVEQSEEAGTLPLETVPVAAVLAAAAGDCAPRAAERSIVLETGCPAELAAEVNSPLLEQALINLVDNAIKHSDPGRAVRLAAATAGDEVVITVRDEGCGIAAEHLPRLFERFYRVDKARSRRLGGTGLGLSIVKHIAQAHGGTVAVESAPGAGSTFTIRLPRRRRAKA